MATSGQEPFLLFFLLLLALFFLLQPAQVDAIYAEKTVYLKSYVTTFQKFGFAANGTVSITKVGLVPDEAWGSIFFYLCTADQWLSLYTEGDVKSQCSIISNSSTSTAAVCELSHVPFSSDSQLLKRYHVLFSAEYYFVALRCFGADQAETDSGPHVPAVGRGESQGAVAAVAEVDERLSPRDGHRPIDTNTGFPGDAVQLDISYVLLNPGNKHLPVGSAPLPVLYSVLVTWWVWLILLYGLTLAIKLRHPSFSMWTPPGWGISEARDSEAQVVSLHWALLFVLVVKLGVELCAMFYWRLCDTTGHCYTELTYAERLLFAPLFESLFFALLLLVSKGWKITKWKLPVSEMRSIITALMLLLSTLLFFALYNQSYYYFSIFVMYLYMLPKIFSAILKNTRRLSAQATFVACLLEEHGRAGLPLPQRLPRLSSLYAKLRLFRFLKVAVGIYIVWFVVLFMLKMTIPWDYSWASSFLEETSSVVFVSFILLLLAPNSKLFSRNDILDESSLPWLYRNVLQRLMESGEEEAGGEGIFGMGPTSLNGDATSTKVDFGDGNVSELNDLVVFEFPSAQFSELATTGTVGEGESAQGQGKGKALLWESVESSDASDRQRAAANANETQRPGRCLSIGTVEQLQRKKRERKGKKKVGSGRKNAAQSEYDHGLQNGAGVETEDGGEQRRPCHWRQRFRLRLIGNKMGPTHPSDSNDIELEDTRQWTDNAGPANEEDGVQLILNNSSQEETEIEKEEEEKALLP